MTILPPTKKNKSSTTTSTASASATNEAEVTESGQPSNKKCKKRRSTARLSPIHHYTASPHPVHGSRNSDHDSDDDLQRRISSTNYYEREKEFLEILTTKGLILRRTQEDGACLFRSVAWQIYGDEEMHDVMRKNVMDYMLLNRDHFSAFVSEDFDEYVARKRFSNTFGNHVEIQAMAELFNRPIEVYQYSTEPINIFQTTSKSSDPPVRLSYHFGSHYNLIIDPNTPSVGVGLGMPALEPGLADRQQLSKAKAESEKDEIEQAMLEDKLKKTGEAIEEQVLRESYMEWLNEQGINSAPTASQSIEKRSTPPPPQKRSETSTASPSSVADSGNKKQSKSTAATSSSASASASTAAPAGISWEDFTIYDGEEDVIMQQVLAKSEADYFNSFTR